MTQSFSASLATINDRCVIRHGHPSDLSSLVDIYNHYIRETAITFDITPYTIEERRASWFESFEEEGRYQCLVAEEDHRIVGYGCSTKFRPKAAYGLSVETSIYLDPQYCHQGYGPPLYDSLLARLSATGVHRAYAGITLPNPASVALHQSLGFRPCGLFREVGFKFEQYWDVAWFEKTF
ncbi:MAG: N-acetyltransferase family protein [Parvularculales bacterium]